MNVFQLEEQKEEAAYAEARRSVNGYIAQTIAMRLTEVGNGEMDLDAATTAVRNTLAGSSALMLSKVTVARRIRGTSLLRLEEQGECLVGSWDGSTESLLDLHEVVYEAATERGRVSPKVGEDMFVEMLVFLRGGTSPFPGLHLAERTSTEYLFHWKR